MPKSLNFDVLDPDLPQSPASRSRSADAQAQCAMVGCPLVPRPVGTKAKTRPLCRDHHAAAMRDWRAKRRAAGLSVAGASPVAPSSSRTAVRRRVALHRAIAAGEVERRPCGDCGTDEGVLAIVLDPVRPEMRTWRCRIHRHEEVAGRERSKKEAADKSARYAEYQTLGQQRLTALELLAAAPADVQDAIHSEVGAMMLGPIRLRPGMPAYQIQLALLAEARLRR